MASVRLAMTEAMEHHWHEDRQIQSRHTGRFGGVDHGSKGIILAEVREGNQTVMRLVWFEGTMRPAAGVRGFGHVYSPAHLTIIDGRGYWLASIFDEGRITKSRLMDHARDIDAKLGNGATALIDPKRTLIIIRVPEGAEKEGKK